MSIFTPSRKSMLLSSVDIEDEILSGGLVFDPPLQSVQLSSISIDMGIVRLRQLTKDGTKLVEPIFVDGRTLYQLEPHEFYLADTKNSVHIASLMLAGRVTTRSRFARQGIMINMTSDRIAPGFKGNIVLEIYNASKIACPITADSRICQIEFCQMRSRPKSAYGPVKTF